MTKRRQWPRGKNGDLPDWYGPDLPFVERTMGELMREDNERDNNYDGSFALSDWQWPDKLQRAITAASLGDIAPLRELYPEISEYINPPKRKRGVTLPKNRRRKYVLIDWAVVAAGHAQDIYAQWQRDYGMKNRRRSLGQSTAVEIAVAYVNLSGQRKVSVPAVERALWRHGRGRKQPARSAIR